jgi:hypothetical protein
MKPKAPKFTPEQHAYIAAMFKDICGVLRKHAGLGTGWEGFVVEASADYMKETGPFDRKKFKAAIEQD